MLTLTSLILGASGIFVLRSDMDAPMAGFILTFALDLSSQIFWLLDRVVDLEEHMVSVERIAEGTPPDTLTIIPSPRFADECCLSRPHKA